MSCPSSSYLNRVGLLGTALLCVYGTYHDPSLPLSWLLIIPSVWGGLTLTVRGTAYLALTVALIAAAMTYLPQNQFGYSGWLPAASIVDLLVIASTTFALLLTLMREQRGRLIGELDRKGAESEAQRVLLSTVFDSMNDGVMVRRRHRRHDVQHRRPAPPRTPHPHRSPAVLGGDLRPARGRRARARGRGPARAPAPGRVGARAPGRGAGR